MTPPSKQFTDFLEDSIKEVLDQLIETQVAVSVISQGNPTTVSECFYDDAVVLVTVDSEFNYFMETHVLLATMFTVDGSEPVVGFAINPSFGNITYRVSWVSNVKLDSK